MPLPPLETDAGASAPPVPRRMSPPSTDPHTLLILLTHPAPGGAGAFAFWLGELLTARGHRVEFLCLYGDGGTATLPSLLSDPPRGPTDYARILLRCWRHLRRTRPTAVYGLMPLACFVGASTGLLAGCRSRVAGQHQVAHILHPLMRRLDRWCGNLGIYTASVACSKAARDSLIAPGSRYWRRSTVIYNTIRPPAETADRDAARRRFALPADAFVIGSIGELTVRKNQIFLVELLPRLPAARLVIVGGGEERERIARRAGELDVADRCHLLGRVAPADVPSLLAAFDVFGFPSLGEAFPLAILEAMRAGLPIVASDIPMNGEALQGRDAVSTGITLPVGEPTRWLETLLALQRDPIRRHALGAAAAARFARFSPAAMADAYETVLFQPGPLSDELYTV